MASLRGCPGKLFPDELLSTAHGEESSAPFLQPCESFYLEDGEGLCQMLQMGLRDAQNSRLGHR